MEPGEDVESPAEYNSAVFTTYHVAGSKTLRYERERSLAARTHDITAFGL